MWWAEHEDLQADSDDGWLVRIVLKCARMGLYVAEVLVNVVGIVIICGAFVVIFMLFGHGQSDDRGNEYSSQVQEDQVEEWHRELERSKYPDPNINEIWATQDAERYRQESERLLRRAEHQAYTEGSRAIRDSAGGVDPSWVDCSEFETWEEAYSFYEGAGGPELDPFWLDDDKDGIPCELLPRWDEVYGD